MAFTLGFLAGCMIWMVNEKFIYGPTVNTYNGREALFTGTVCAYPEKKTDYSNLYVLVREVDNEPVRFKVRLSLNDAEGFEPGDAVVWYGKLKLPTEYYYFSNINYLRTKRVFLTSGADSAQCLKEKPVWWTIPLRFAGKLSARLRELMPERDSALMMGLILGDDAGLDDEFQNRLRTVGLSHLIAVSGMNVAFMVSIIFVLFGRKTGNYIALPAILFFMLMAGFTASVVRAGIMQMTAVLAYKTERDYDSFTAMAAAACVMFLINPYSIADAGLWMSFLASLGLMIVYPKLTAAAEKRRKPKNPVWRKLGELAYSTACTTLSAQLFVLPLQAALFGTLSLAALPANMLCVWAAESAFFLGTAAAGLSMLWYGGGKLLASAAAALTEYIYFITDKLAALPGAQVSAKNIYILAALVVIYGLLALSFFLGSHGKLTAICSVLILLSAVGAVHTEKAGSCTIRIFDGTAGQSVVVRSGGDCVIINSGSYSGSVTRYLSENSLRVRALLLTDYRSSSAGDAEAILSAVPVKELLLPAVEDPRRDTLETFAGAEDCRVVSVEDRGEVDLDGIRIEYYVNHSDEEDNGRLLTVVYGRGHTVLVPGSIRPENLESFAEKIAVDGAVIAGGDYYAAHVLPKRIAECGDTLILSSYSEPDKEKTAWTAYTGIHVRRMEKGGSAALTVPQK